MSYCPFPCMPALHTRCRRGSGGGVYRLAGVAVPRTEEILCSYCAEYTLCSAPARVRGKGRSAPLMRIPSCCPSSSGFGTGWRIIISVPRAMSIKQHFLPGLKLRARPSQGNPDFQSDVQLPEKEQKILDLLAAEPEQCITKLEKESGIRISCP